MGDSEFRELKRRVDIGMASSTDIDHYIKLLERALGLNQEPIVGSPTFMELNPKEQIRHLKSLVNSASHNVEQASKIIAELEEEINVSKHKGPFWRSRREIIWSRLKLDEAVEKIDEAVDQVDEIEYSKNKI